MTTGEEHSFRKAFPVESYPQYYERPDAKVEALAQDIKAKVVPTIKQEVRWIADIVAWRLRNAFNV